MKTINIGDITFNGELDQDKELSISYRNEYTYETTEYIDRKQAIELATHLITLFKIKQEEVVLPEDLFSD